MTESDRQPAAQSVNTGGGAYIGGDMHLDHGSTFVGRDQLVITDTQQYDVHGHANPYLGLQSFTYPDHAKYAGREKLIAETVARLTAPDDPLALLFVTGASGSGKSSFVQAGVLPVLEQHYAALSVKWAVFRSLRDPLAALSDALWRQLGLPQFDASTDFGDFLKTHTPQQQINVIVIDQFEELFTQSNAQPRDALFALLTQLPPFRSTRTHIIATVRADYLPELFALPTLYDIARRGIDLRAMSVDELREAIQQPLRATYPDKDKRFQAELVDRLAKDAAEDASYLPLLQVTLEEIWRKGTLTVGSYTNLTDAIQQRADKVLEYQDYDAAQPNQPRTPEEQAAILNLCLDLVDVSLDDEARRDVRRRRSKDELVSSAPERARLIDTLTQARLLSVGTESGEQPHVEVDLIHETLLSNWDRLRQAIAERRHELRQRVRFEQQLKEWIGQDRLDDYLLTGVRLAEARELERRDDVALHSADAKDLVRCSVEREETHRKKELNDARNRAVIFSVVAIVAIVAAGIAFFFGDQSSRNAYLAEHNAATAQAASTLAVEQRDKAQQQARVALSQQLAAQAVSHLDNQYILSILLDLEAINIEQTFEARNLLLTALQSSPLLETFIQGHKDRVNSVAFSPDGRVLASGSDDKTIILWDVSNPNAPVQMGTPLSGHKHRVNSVAFSPNGRVLASGGDDKTIILWDLTNPKTPVQMSKLFYQPSDRVLSVAFSPDGNMLASGNPHGMIALWNVSNPSTPVQVGTPLVGHEEGVGSLVFSPNGKMLASGSGGEGVKKIILWDVSDPKSPVQASVPITGYEYNASIKYFSPDGKTLAAQVNDKILRWDVSNPRSPIRLGELLAGQNTIGSTAFSPDGKIIAAGNKDHTISIWDVSNPNAPVQMGIALSGHSSYVSQVTFSPDGKTLVSGSGDGAIGLWNVSDLKHPVQLDSLRITPHTSAVRSVAFSSKGILASGSDNGTTILWDVSNPRLPVQMGTPLTSDFKGTWSIAFSPDGNILALGDTGGRVNLWDVSNPKIPRRLGVPFAVHTLPVLGVAFSPDGKILVSSSSDMTIAFEDVSNPATAVQLGVSLTGHGDHLIESVAFNPDGKTVASGDDQGMIILWNVSNPKSPIRVGAPLTNVNLSTIKRVVFSLNGKMLASGNLDGEVVIWDVSSPNMPIQIGTPLIGHMNDDMTVGISDIAFSPDGKMLASANDDGTINLWDISNPTASTQVGARLVGHTNYVTSVAFSPNGKTLASGSCSKMDKGICLQGEIILWDVDPISWQAHACQIVGRNLTHAEWQQYMGDEPYRKTCDQWPLEPEATPTPDPTPTP